MKRILDKQRLLRVNFLAILICTAALCLGCGGPTTRGPGPSGGGGENAQSANNDGSSSAKAMTARLNATPPTTPWIDTVGLDQSKDTLSFVTANAELWQWSLSKGTLSIKGRVGEARESFEMRPNGNLIVAVGGDAPRIIEADTQKELMRFAAWERAGLVRWSVNGSRFALGRSDGGIAIWDVAEQLQGFTEGERLEDFLKRQEPAFQVDLPGNPTALSIAPDGRFVVGLNDNMNKGTIFVWNPDTGNELVFIGRTKADIKHLSVSDDSKFVATLNKGDGSLRVASLDRQPKGFLRWSVELKARAVDWSPLGHLLLHDKSGETRAIDPANGETVWKNADANFERCWSAKKQLICSDSRSLALLDAATGERLVTAAAWGGMFLLFTPDGHFSGDAKPETWLEVTEGGETIHFDTDTWRSLRSPSAIVSASGR